MREIRFRLWSKEEQKYYMPENKEEGLIRAWTDSEDEECILEQFTGLRDKNGREIYEGDICHFDLQDFNGGDHFYTLPVAYTVDMFGFPYKSDPSESEPDCCISLGEAVANDDELEVVGNIHENPELLK